jgi:phenylalanyl-tRNA synthetase beta chain
MRVPVSWLRDYVPLPMPLAELAERLSISAAEVTTIEMRGPADEDGNHALFLVGKVLEAGKHPNADRLQLCQVDVGEGSPRQIVCGAWNFGAGASVAVALPGARLPGAEEPLGEAKLRGELSRGMILSERELELGADHAGIMVLPETEPGTPLADVLPLADSILDVDPTGNRVDLLSVYGLAREVAALFGLELAPPPGGDPAQRGSEPVEIRIDDLDGCPRYVGRTFDGVRIEPSPPWLRARLTGAGMRPISNVVDITNYVMLALGNPLHAFDRTTLAGGRIVVRRAARGEKLRTLDGVERDLDERDLVIADAERAIALAGIMGGEETEVRESSTEILLEAANFEPFGLLRSSERLKLRTEGSNRWEKGVDPYLAPQAAKFATELLVELAGARWLGDSDVRGELPAPPVIAYRPGRADELIGLETPASDQREILGTFGFEVDDDWNVTVPTWRSRDVTREVDLIEEIARVRMDDVPFTLPPRRAMFGALTPLQRLRRRVEDVLTGLGLAEIYTPSLVPAASEPDGLALPDPMGDQAVLRQTLLHGLLDAAGRNASLGNERIRLFEIARVYIPRGEELPDERLRVGGVVEGGFAQAKGVVEALYRALKAEPRVERHMGPALFPGRAARVDEGWFGELHPTLLDGSWGAFELDLEGLLAASRDPVQYEDVITFPAVKQDLAFVVDESVAAGDLIAAAREAAGPELRELRVFDVYRGGQIGAGKKSIALAASFQSPERTLSDEDAAAIRERIVQELSNKYGAELRS